MLNTRRILPAAFMVALMAIPAGAETNQIRAAQQYGLSYLPLMIMEDSKLVEKHAVAEGLKDLTTSWVKLGGSAPMNDALLSGSIDFGAGGIPNLTTLWAKTKSTPLAVRGVGALNNMPVDLVTTNPNVKSLKDFSATDKIAVTSIKVSTQALLLQMAVAKEYGQENYEKLDSLTVAMPHPEAMTALMSGAAGINGHFSSPPFQYQELKDPRVRRILNSYDILGGPSTFNVVWGTSKFRDENPKAYKAFSDALAEAVTIINADKRAAAETYKRMTNTKETIEELQAMLEDPLVEMTMTPKGTARVAGFMKSVGRVPEAPASWQDLFFPEIHNRPGS
jgi:NitT/TauT family transport system substrate-binding protein